MDKDTVLDLKVVITVELGRKRIPIKDVISMANGSVIELDSLTADPLKFYVNGKLFGTCKVVQVKSKNGEMEKFGMQIVEIFNKNTSTQKVKPS